MVRVIILLALAACIQVSAYFTGAKIMVPGSWSGEQIIPMCTLDVKLKPYGATGSLDIYFNASVGDFTTRESLEVVSQLCFPKTFMIDSMVLWIAGKPQPAIMISVGQANATYNEIVGVRRDPAMLVKLPEDSWWYPMREGNTYELKVFPIFKDSTRHVKLMFHISNDILSDMKNLLLGTPGNANIVLRADTSLSEIPEVSSGRLTLKKKGSEFIFSVVDPDSGAFMVSRTDSISQIMPGVHGMIQTVGSYYDTGYFSLNLDVYKMFALDTFRQTKKLTIVWVPSTYQTMGDDDNPWLKEQEMIGEYLEKFTAKESFNIIYAGKTTQMFEPHMVPALQGTISRAKNFLGNREYPNAQTDPRNYFEALQKAFSSIASSDVPALVFCMDREPAASGTYDNRTEEDRMVKVLVEINVNKAKFYAWVHSSKYYFYSSLARALNGTVTFYYRDPYYYYDYEYYWNWYGYDNFKMERLDESFIPAIDEVSVGFSPYYSQDIVEKRDIRNFSDYNYYYYYYQDRKYDRSSYSINYSGKCRGFVYANCDFKIGGKVYRKNISIYSNGSTTEEQGLCFNKEWAVDMVDHFRTNYYWNDYYYGYGKTKVLNPSPAIKAIENKNFYDDGAYAEMVKISLANKVVTCASALLALEPGMDLSEESQWDRYTWGTWGIATTSTEKDSVMDKDSLKLTACPNPFNPSTRIIFSGLRGKRENVTLTIFDVNGRLVKAFKVLSGYGKVEFLWDGTNANGKKLGSGMYVGRVQMGGKTSQVRLLLAK